MGLFSKKHSIGNTIASLRKQKGWTQSELADKLQISDKAVSKWEKDGCTPSIEFFPQLAELFDVSIDYLMTGKDVEEKVVTISKAELCAKKDDVKLMEGLDPGHKDENGKTLVDYIIQYESRNVFVEGISKFPRTAINILDAFKMCLITNRLDLMCKKTFQSTVKRAGIIKIENEHDLLNLLPVEALEKFKNQPAAADCVLTSEFFDFIVSGDNRIKDTTLDFLFGNQFKRECVWYHAFPYIIHRAYVNGNKKLVYRLVNIANENNEKGYDLLKSTDTYNRESNYYFVSFHGNYAGHGFVRVLEDTIKLTLANGDFDLFDKFYSLNSKLDKQMNNPYQFKVYIPTEYDIRMAKLRADKSVSREKLIEESVIHDGIVNLDELLKEGDIKIAKKVLKEYPIHFLEKPISLFMEKDYKTLFKWAIDNDEHDVARICADRYENETNRNIAFSSFVNKYREKISINDAILRETLRIYPELIGRRQCRMNFGNVGSIEQMFDMFCKCKQFVLKKIEDVKRELQIMDELSNKYFEKQLANDNIEMVVIKLCVRLEAVLKLVCHYEGTFEEMLTRYCNDGKCDANMAILLNKLRKQRNNCVHAEKSYDDLTKAELQLCIDYICNIK